VGLAASTTVVVAGLAMVPQAAHADSSVIVPAVSVLPYCAQASDTLGNVGQLCVNSITETPIAGETGDLVTANGSLKVCDLGRCSIFPLALSATGAGLNLSDAVPSIVANPPVTIPVPEHVCVGTTCTPGSVNVPSFTVTLFPNPPLATVCADGICSISPLSPVTVTDSTPTGFLASLISTN
jgi:hypothetical protein